MIDGAISCLCYNKASRGSAGNTTAALTKTLPVSEESVMAALQPNCAGGNAQVVSAASDVRIITNGLTSIGDKSGPLTIIGHEFFAKRIRFVVVECKCGEVRVVEPRRFLAKSQKPLACGQCSLIESGGHVSACHNKHYLYYTWTSMIARCRDRWRASWKNYGGRGISVCNEWRSSFPAFVRWAMENGHQHGLTLDRINNDGNYEPSNCRWVSVIHQGNNKRTNTVICAFGERKTMAEWLRDHRCGITSGAGIQYRLMRGWSAEEAISKPRRKMDYTTRFVQKTNPTTNGARR